SAAPSANGNSTRPPARRCPSAPTAAAKSISAAGSAKFTRFLSKETPTSSLGRAKPLPSQTELAIDASPLLEYSVLSTQYSDVRSARRFWAQTPWLILPV